MGSFKTLIVTFLLVIARTLPSFAVNCEHNQKSHQQLESICEQLSTTRFLAAQPKKSMKEYWKAADFPYSSLKAEILKNITTEKGFLASVEAINTILLATKPPLILTSAPNDPGSTIRKQFAGVAIIQDLFKPEGEDFIARFNSSRKAEEKRLNDWKQFYRANREALSIASISENMESEYLYHDFSSSPLINSFQADGKWQEQPFPAEAILDWIEKEYLTSENASHLSAMGMNAFLSVFFDPHTRISPKDYDQDMRTWSDAWTGIGVRLVMQNKVPVIADPLEGGSAIAAGIQPRDVIVKVDDQDISGLSLEEIANRIKGPEGTDVNLTVRRNNDLRSITMKRKTMEIENVSIKQLEGADDILQIKANQFLEGTCEAVANAIRKEILEKRNKKSKVVLDLRNNPGGYLEEAICMAALFLEPSQVILQQKNYKDPNVLTTYSRQSKIQNIHFDGPLAVLINSESASASEIVAGALQDNHRAVIVGERSFGKGTIQVENKSPFERISFIKTIGEFYRPSGTPTFLKGVMPNFVAYEHPDPTREDIFALREEMGFKPGLVEANAISVAVEWNELDAIRACIESNGNARKLFNEFDSRQEFREYPLLVSEDVLKCMPPLEPTIVEKSKKKEMSG